MYDERSQTPLLALRKIVGIALLAVMILGMWTKAAADSRDVKIQQLESHLTQLAEEVQRLKQDRVEDRQQQSEHREALEEIRNDLVRMGEGNRLLDPDSWLNKFTVGGYGELHGNFGEGKSSDQFDIHRLVLYLGYDFNEWIKLHSETEIEHAFVSKSSGGEVVIEQLYVDFLISKWINVRVGRILTPLGIINETHEPTTFNGVERPLFAKVIIPSTWSSDGVGIFGSLASWLKYQLYVAGGLDGSGFNATDGIRKGRMKERPGLHEPAVTGRLDFYPLVSQEEVPFDQDLRLGLSMYFGGLDNGNKGKNPRLDGHIHIYSADFQYSIDRFDFRGAIAYEAIDGAREIGNGTAKGIFGWYTEAAYHFWQDAWKTGKFKASDAVVFVRFDRADTQHEMPSGVAANPAGDRHEWTIGMNFYFTPNLVFKVDYQLRDDDSAEELNDLLNVGLGWTF